MHNVIRSQKRFVLFSFFLLGSFLIPGCTSRSGATKLPAGTSHSRSSSVININTAERREIETLPRVGTVLAEKIIEHRKRYGPFQEPEHLLIIDGVSEARFRGFREFITTE